MIIQSMSSQMKTATAKNGLYETGEEWSSQLSAPQSLRILIAVSWPSSHHYLAQLMLDYRYGISLCCATIIQHPNFTQVHSFFKIQSQHAQFCNSSKQQTPQISSYEHQYKRQDAHYTQQCLLGTQFSGCLGMRCCTICSSHCGKYCYNRS